MIVAQIGCLHGEMDKMYEKLQQWEQVNSRKIDVVLCCGDFQSLRDEGDLDALKCPQKFKKIGGFAQYFSREKRAPMLTLFIGGNHEASNLLRDLYYGGYVAENIYFLGYSNVIKVTKGEHSLRIGGISGIEKSHDSRLGYHEEWPYVHREKNLTSMYHIRTFEVAKLSTVQKTPVDFFLSHEWPTVATSHRSFQQNQGFQQLLRYKPFFKKEIQRGELGSPLLSELLERIQPRVLWCSAHLHCQYRISVPVANTNKFVEFQSLDKPEGNKRFADVFSVEFQGPDSVPTLSKDGLTSTWDNRDNNRGGHHGGNQGYQRGGAQQQMVWAPKNSAEQAVLNNVVHNAEEETKDHAAVEEHKDEQPQPAQQEVQLCYDTEWLAILQLSQEMIPLEYNAPIFQYPLLTADNIAAKMAEISQDNLKVVYDPVTTFNRTYSRVHPQTRLFIDKFGLDDRLFEARQQKFQQINPYQTGILAGQKRTFQEANYAEPQPIAQPAAATVVTQDDNEIDLDDL